MQAVLWDGNKQIMGTLFMGVHSLQFRLEDFECTDLNFDLPYDSIQEVKYMKIYGIVHRGLRILNFSGNENVFVVSDPIKLRKAISQKIRNRKGHLYSDRQEDHHDQ